MDRQQKSNKPTGDTFAHVREKSKCDRGCQILITKVKETLGNSGLVCEKKKIWHVQF